LCWRSEGEESEATNPKKQVCTATNGRERNCK
ncbi:hypothetical protein A2U01_0086115, partial [Trifolium medium]|nr:hypothetical protein [Trifolium medium]